MTTASALVSARTVFVDKDGRLTAEGLKILARLSDIAVTGPVMGTVTATTSGTSIDIPDIPVGVKRILVSIASVSTNGSAVPWLQLGTISGIETSGYLGADMSHPSGAVNAGVNVTSAFGWAAGGATGVSHGTLTLTLLDGATNTWTYFGVIGASNAAVTITSGGSKSLAGVLDRIRLTTANGTDTYDAGKINIMYD